MLDLKFVVDNADAVRANAERKGDSCNLDGILELNRRRLELISREETFQAELNRVNKEISPVIGMLKKSGATRVKIEAALAKAVDPEHSPNLHERLSTAVGAGVDTLQKTLGALRREKETFSADLRDVLASLDAELARVPNMVDASVPSGADAEDNVVVLTAGVDKPTFGFEPKPHWDLTRDLGLLQMETGAKLTGSGFPAITGDLARLEWALISFFLDRAHAAGYTPWMVPLIVNEQTLFGTGYLPKMRDEVYHLDERDPGMFLIPTAEAPLTSIHGGEHLTAEELPKLYCAWSACFRREAGASGTGTRGLLRVHQFNKVELFILARPEESAAYHEKLRLHSESLLAELGLHYRVLELCDGDMSFAAAKCWDLETFAPGVGEWLEVSSISNFATFQARRCNLRFRDPKTGKLRYCHTINGSGLATPRTLVALLETYQQANGSIRVPDVLQPYLSGQTVISA